MKRNKEGLLLNHSRKAFRVAMINVKTHNFQTFTLRILTSIPEDLQIPFAMVLVSLSEKITIYKRSFIYV